MLDKLRPRSVYDVMAAIACFGVLAGGTAYAAATITGDDVVNESLTGADVQGRGGSSPVNGSLTGEDIGGQAANSSTGTPFVEGTLTQWDVRNNSLTGGDVADNSLKGADIDEGSLVGGPGSPSGKAGGDLTGSYPNPEIRDQAVGRRELGFNLFWTADNSGVPIGPNGGVGTNEATCPEGSRPIGGGGWFDFNSGDLSGSFQGSERAWRVTGQNNGQLEQDLHAHVLCLK